MNDKETYKIRPAGRHVLTIGEDLIQDKFAALVELVKNAYDADSSEVNICFTRNKMKGYIEIVVEDFGHGMSKSDVVNKWLVPSTNYKLINRVSPLGRIMQGRKGIGRYAASILGGDLLLETVDKDHVKTCLFVDWEQFRTQAYLDEVEILVESQNTQESPGTKLTIRGPIEGYDTWDDKQLKKLKFELKKLIPPKAEYTFDDDFRINLQFDSFFDDQLEIFKEEIKPYPILEFFDYKISGVINQDGTGVLTYNNQKARNFLEEHIKINLGSTHCGKLIVDIRAYDRDKDAIDVLINRGLKDDSTGHYISKLEARQLLNEVNGVGVYRNGFRIRPLGDADFDWLKLNARRIQTPSLKLGSNQVAGYVHIESEEISNLEEKSARDGLRNNFAFEKLVEIVDFVISELEKRRFSYRRKMGLASSSKKIDKGLDDLFDYSMLKKSIFSSLKKANLDDDVIEEIDKLISKDQHIKSTAIEEIKHTVAVYQGQATLGKIINIILHEGRRPLNYFRNQIPNLEFYTHRFKETSEKDSLDSIIDISSGIKSNVNTFVELFGRLDPLAAKKRTNRTPFDISDVLNDVIILFQNELELKDISINLICNENLSFVGWKQDFYTIFANLIDNSLFWIEEKKCETRLIQIIATSSNGDWIIDYMDSGPGVESNLLENDLIFEPQFTTKPNGTGLGLSIAGEAANRNGILLTALESDKGAHFRLSYE